MAWGAAAFAQTAAESRLQQLRNAYSDAAKANDQAKMKEIREQMKPVRDEIRASFLKAHPEAVKRMQEQQSLDQRLLGPLMNAGPAAPQGAPAQSALVQQRQQLRAQLRDAVKAHDQQKIQAVKAQLMTLRKQHPLIRKRANKLGVNKSP